jgi:CheY-like chemotaxis protein
MTSILVVDDDPPLRRALVRDLRANGYDAVAASGYDEALTRASERKYDVLLTDLRMGSKNGLDLILALTGASPQIRPIMMSAYATAHDSQRALSLGAVRVLCKPFESEQLIQAVERAVQSTSGFAGSVHGLSLVDLLQMFHFARHSVTLHLRGGGGGSVSLRDGELIDARYEALRGEPALRAVLSLSAGVVETTELSVDEASLSGRFESTLLEALRWLDERKPPGETCLSVESALDALSEVGTEPASPATAADPLGALCERWLTGVAGALFCGVVDRHSHTLLASRSLSSGDLSAPLDGSPAIGALADFEEVQGRCGEILHVARRLGGQAAVVALIAADAAAEAGESLRELSTELERVLARVACTPAPTGSSEHV